MPHKKVYTSPVKRDGPSTRIRFLKKIWDKQGAIAFFRNPVHQQRCKYIHIKYHFIRDTLHNDSINITSCSTADMFANIMTKSPRGIPRGVMVKVMNCGIVVSEFVLQSRYCVHFRANTLGKGMNPLILQAMG